MVHKTDILYTAVKTPKLYIYIYDSYISWLQQRLLQRTCEIKPSVQEDYQHGIPEEQKSHVEELSTTWWIWVVTYLTPTTIPP